MEVGSRCSKGGHGPGVARWLTWGSLMTCIHPWLGARCSHPHFLVSEKLGGLLKWRGGGP